MPASYRLGTWAFGITRKCTGACGRTSWNARMSSSSCSFFAGISPRTILQKMQSGSVFMFSRRFFVKAGNALAPVQLGEHVAGSEPVAREQDHAVEPQVGGFAHQMQAVAAFRREHRLRSF